MHGLVTTNLNLTGLFPTYSKHSTFSFGGKVVELHNFPQVDLTCKIFWCVNPYPTHFKVQLIPTQGEGKFDLLPNHQVLTFGQKMVGRPKYFDSSCWKIAKSMLVRRRFAPSLNDGVRLYCFFYSVRNNKNDLKKPRWL